MKKIIVFCNVLLCVAVMFGLGACASTPSNSAPTVATPKGIIGAEGVPQPEWVRNIPVAEDVMYFVGEGRSGKTTTAKKNSALQDAGRQLATWKQSVISAAIKDYVRESGETGNTQSLEDLEIASVEKARANTSGMKATLTWINAEGNFVILVEYPKADIKNDFMTEVNNFVRNESAAFAEFKAEEAYKALEESLDNNM